MQQPEIYQRLTGIFHEVFGDDSIVLTPETTATDIPDWDSANHISLVVGAEARFGIRFKTAELEELRNVGEFVELIGKKLANRRP